jgi:hypothetical protein
MEFFGNEHYNIEMRVRTVCELVQNESLYLDNKQLQQMSGENIKSCDLVEYLLSTTESYPSKAVSNKEAYREEVMATVHEFRFCSMLHIYALVNALSVMIHSVYPDVKTVGVNRKIHHQIISPINCSHVPRSPIYIMWSNKTELLVSQNWTPDHFVALMPLQYTPDMYTTENVRFLTI